MIAPTMFHALADASSAASIMHSYVAPIIRGMCILASLVCVFFLVNGGIQYTTSNGKPERLESAKTIIRNTLIGLVIVLAAATLTAILSHAYSHAGTPVATQLPTLNDIESGHDAGGLPGALIKAVAGFLDNIIQTAAAPFLKALSYFTTSTPLIADNPGVFNLWLGRRNSTYLRQAHNFTFASTACNGRLPCELPLAILTPNGIRVFKPTSHGERD